MLPVVSPMEVSKFDAKFVIRIGNCKDFGIPRIVRYLVIY